jgi:CheY-like chemotaxis protein
MNNALQYQLLVVDDEPSVRESTAMLLTATGYRVRTAVHGLDALLQIKQQQPDLIISDLNMPQMSGFELLSIVRRRFPEIPVVAVSGAYDFSGHVPSGVIADAFYAKGQHHPSDLLRTVAGLIENKGKHQSDPKRAFAPVWIPRNGTNAIGVPFVVVTCTDCLRSFPMNVEYEGNQEIQETVCLSCDTKLQYIIDFTLVLPENKVRSAALGAV